MWWWLVQQRHQQHHLSHAAGCYVCADSNWHMQTVGLLCCSVRAGRWWMFAGCQPEGLKTAPGCLKTARVLGLGLYPSCHDGGKRKGASLCSLLPWSLGTLNNQPFWLHFAGLSQDSCVGNQVTSACRVFSIGLYAVRGVPVADIPSQLLCASPMPQSAHINFVAPCHILGCLTSLCRADAQARPGFSQAATLSSVSHISAAKRGASHGMQATRGRNTPNNFVRVVPEHAWPACL